MDKGVLWRNLEVRPVNCAFSPDARHMACASQGSPAVENIAVLDARTGALLRSFGHEHFGERPVELLAWSPDGARLAAATNYLPQSETEERGVLYEASTGEVLRRLDLGEASRIRDLVFTEEGTRLVAVSIPQVYRWAGGGQESVETILLDMAEYGGEAASLSPAGPHLATGREEVILWNTETGQRQSVLQQVSAQEGQTRPYTTLHFSTDGRWLAGATSAGKVAVWNTSTGEKHAEWDLAASGTLSSRTQPPLSFLGENLLAAYFTSQGQVYVMNVSDRKKGAFEAPKGSPGGARMAARGERFVFPSNQARPLALYQLCRGNSPCGTDEGATPARLAAVFPTELAGLDRAGTESYWGESGPQASALYMDGDRALQVEVSGLATGELEKMRQRYEAASQEANTFKEAFKGYDVYGGGGEERSGLVVLLSRAAVMMEGNLPSQKLLTTLGTLPIDRIETLMTGSETEK